MEGLDGKSTVVTIVPFEWDKHRFEWRDIENTMEFPWTLREMKGVLCNGGLANAYVAVDQHDKMLGYIFALPDGKELEIFNLCVRSDKRMTGVGRNLVRHMITRARKRRKKNLTVVIRETNLDAQLFFRKQGFTCVETLKGYYEDHPEEDAYYFNRELV